MSNTADAFAQFRAGLESPAGRVADVIPSDSVDLNMATRAINVAGTGSVRVTTTDGSIATVFVAVGIPFPVRATRIWATGTTATNIVAMP